MDLRDASASENVEHVDIVYNVGVDFEHCRAMLKQCKQNLKKSLADYSIWIQEMLAHIKTHRNVLAVHREQELQ